MSYNILIDTCFWIALYDERDQYHHVAIRINENYLPLAENIIIPFPTMYETINTRFTRRKKEFKIFSEQIKGKCDFIHDEKYRESALELTFEKNRTTVSYSLVDMTLRLMLDDINIKIDGFITFNKKDFFDICHIRNIAIIDDY